MIAALPDPIQQVASVDFPTQWGRFRMVGFERDLSPSGWPRRESALALLMGDLKAKPPLLRIHSQCLTGDALGSLRCDCGQQLRMAFSMIAREGAGILIYEEQEGRGIGLRAKLEAYELQDLGQDTVEANEGLGLKADYRDFHLPAQILRQLGISAVRLITNNPSKVSALQDAGIAIVERVSCEVAPDPNALRYLQTKKDKLGQLLTLL
ncbi:MAG: GTP cyclohydrolase II [Terriglobales bacterium]